MAIHPGNSCYPVEDSFHIPSFLNAHCQLLPTLANHGYSPTRQQLAIQCFHIPGFLLLDAHCQIFWLRGGGRKCQSYAFKEIFVKSNQHLKIPILRFDTPFHCAHKSCFRGRKRRTRFLFDFAPTADFPLRPIATVNIINVAESS